MVVNAQHGIAPVGLSEALVGLTAVERIDEDGNKRRASGDDPWIAKRTAREVLATLSPGVLAEVHPERLVLLARNGHRRLVVDIPGNVADRNALGP